MATAEDLIGRSLGPYRILEEVGKGGMAVVFKAEDSELDREVALKVLSTDFTQDVRALERFKREAQTTASLDHPNIIKIYGIGEEDGLHYFAMEFLPYLSLHDIIQRDGKLSIDDAVAVVTKALRGLEAAHRAGVIHRDLKPENIMMNAEGDPILVDFGIAKTGKGNRLTQTGVLLGTPYYMSPEQITGKEVQVQSDLYSMGVVLYELLTAQVPFQADSTFMITYKHCTEAPPPPRKLNDEIPESLQRVVLKSLEKDLRKRYQDAGSFADDLERVASGADVDIEVTRKRDIFEIPEYKLGMGHYREKEYAQAREQFQKVVDEVPDPEYAAEANRMIATCFADEQDYVAAYQQHHLTQQRWPDSDQARGVPVHLDGCLFQQVQLGERVLLEHGREAALDVFDDMLDLLDEIEVPLEERQESHWIQQLERRADEIATTIRRLRILKLSVLAVLTGGVLGSAGLFLWFRYVNPFAGHLLQARYEILRGRPDGAEAAYRRALELQPGNVPTMVRLGEVLRFLGSREDARRILDQALERAPSDAMAHELLGEMDLAAEDLEGAEHHFQKAVENAPDRPEAWVNLARVSGLLGKADAEVRFARKAIDKDPTFMDARVQLAEALWRRRREPIEALKELRAATRVRDDHAPTYQLMGKILYDLGKEGDAEEAFLESLRFDPRSPDTHYALAVIYSNQGHREKATKELEDALRNAEAMSRPTHRIHFLLGQIREGVAETREGAAAGELRAQAETHYKEATLGDPGDPRYARRLGLFYANAGQWGHAAGAFERWAALEPGAPEPRIRWGRALLAADRPEEALAPLEEATRLAPRSPEPLVELGRAREAAARAAGQDPGVAGADYRAALALEPDFVPALRALVRLHLRAGAVPEAVELAPHLARVGAEDPEALALAAQAYLRGGDGARAEELLRAALRLAPESLEVLNPLGRLLLATGRVEEGAPLLEKSLALSPLQSEAATLKKELARAATSR